MLVIRMRRMGAKKNPFYRLVVTEQRAARESDFVENLGMYNPTTKPETLQLNRERYDYWVGKGAQPSDTVRTVVKRHKADAAPVEAVAAEQPAS